MLGMNDDPIFAARAIEAGAKGYVSKSGELLRPLRRSVRSEKGICLSNAIDAEHCLCGDPV
jgi:DNA-binding NarL/FixJ family response regulator